MMRFFVVIIVLLVSAGNPASAWGKSGKDAIDSLKKIEAKTQFGISFDDYSRELASTKSKVNFFLGRSEAKNQFNLAESMKKAMEHYDFAMLVWERAKKRKDIESELSQMKRSNKWWQMKGSKGKKESPEERQKEERRRSMGKSLYYLDKTDDFDILLTISARYLNQSKLPEQKTYVDELLPIIWRQASNEVKNANNAFYKQSRTVKETILDEESTDTDIATEESPARLPRRPRFRAAKPPPAPPAPLKAPVVPGVVVPGVRDKD